MGIVPDDEEDGLSSGNLDMQQPQDDTWSMLITAFRSAQFSIV